MQWVQSEKQWTIALRSVSLFCLWINNSLEIAPFRTIDDTETKRPVSRQDTHTVRSSSQWVRQWLSQWRTGRPTDDVNGWPLHYAARLIYSESPPVIEVMILLSFCIPSFPPPPALLAHHPECCCGTWIWSRSVVRDASVIVHISTDRKTAHSQFSPELLLFLFLLWLNSYLFVIHPAPSISVEIHPSTVQSNAVQHGQYLSYQLQYRHCDNDALEMESITVVVEDEDEVIATDRIRMRSTI